MEHTQHKGEKIMKRRILVVLLAVCAALCMAFGVAACKKTAPNETGDNPPVVEPGGQEGEDGDDKDPSGQNPEGQGGKEQGDEEKDKPHEHIYGEWKTEIPATHLTEGTERQFCSCGEYRERTVPKTKEHSYGEWQVETPATHLIEGVKRQYCACGEYREESIPKTAEHSYGDWKVTKEATCKEQGREERECPCGEKETKELPLTGHDFENMTCKGCGLKASLGLEYELINGDREYEVTGLGNCNDLRLIITNKFNGKPVTAIGEEAFSLCDELLAVTIPASVTTVGTGVFAGCFSLAQIEADRSNPVFHAEGNCLIETASKTLVAGCASSEIPTDGSVTSIGAGAFCDCDGLKEFTVPACIETIGEMAFKRCRELKSVTIGGGTIGKEAFAYDQKLERVTIGSNVTAIGQGAFDCCIKLEKISFEGESSLSEIGKQAFQYCNALKQIDLPASLTTIGDEAFLDCGKLAKISFGENSRLRSIGTLAFEYCEKLAEIAIPASVTAIGQAAFDGCDGLKKAYFENADGWSVSKSSSMKNAQILQNLGDPATAAGYLTDEYCNFYWQRSK